VLFAGVAVSNRFKNIKDTFARNLRAMKESKRSGAGTDYIYKPKWHMFDKLMFLKKTCVQENSESNIPSSQLLEIISNSKLSTSQSWDNEVNDNISCTEDTSLFNYYYDDALQVNYFPK